MSAPATCWEDAYRVQTEIIKELRAKNAALRKAKEMVELERCEMMRSMSLAQNQSEQLRADKERLDWLEEQIRCGFYNHATGRTELSALSCHHVKTIGIRAVIDSKRKEAQP